MNRPSYALAFVVSFSCRGCGGRARPPRVGARAEPFDKVLELAQAQGAEAEVFYLEQVETPVEFETNRLKALQTKALQGMALRVIHQGRSGFASTTDLSRPEQLVEAALQTITTFATALPDLPALPTAHTFPTTARLVTQGQELIANLLDFNPDFLVSATFKTHTSTRAIATTSGAP